MSFIKGLKLNQHQETNHSRTYKESSYVKLPKWIWTLNRLILQAQKELFQTTKPKEAVIMLERGKR